MGPRTRVIAGTAVALLAGLVFWGTERWLATRIFEPVNVPITVEARRFESNFQVNLRADYYMRIDLDDSPDDWAYNDAGKCNRYRLREVNWKVLRLQHSQRSEELWAEPETPNSLSIFWGGFHAIPGKYRIELEIPASAACLKARRPRLIVNTDSYFYASICGWIEFFCFLIGSSGVMLALRGVWQWCLGLFKKEYSLRMFPEIALRNVTRRIRHEPQEAIASLNNLAVAWIAVLCAIIVIFYWFLIRPYPLYGLALDFKTPRAETVAASPWAETMSVYIDGQGSFFVNGKIADRTQLGERLREELSKRAVWTVYVEADMKSSFQQTVFAMDTIEGLGGKVIWITPKTRKEWKKNKMATATNP